ncbi:hypothetical protein A2892_03695 [Candidatus Woesebacteria bacterium RIFCSPLOWO2_01_FULL_39_10b]|uniref:Uncharacterized protein n=1 Tax=Candidatus Woesebacteria bacterium RIFCSPLOWO2_01_FULL_39_10b TaxID=1802517 RepID=A0A1F8B996_9BACT|nr:MAG: hypothetical protein A2892_03695 [Candidatus Woesebacteria bacterium RIFCSPLOWO2_01_FULL_39_10b]
MLRKLNGFVKYFLKATARDVRANRVVIVFKTFDLFSFFAINFSHPYYSRTFKNFLSRSFSSIIESAYAD